MPRTLNRFRGPGAPRGFLAKRTIKSNVVVVEVYMIISDFFTKLSTPGEEIVDQYNPT